MIIKKIIDCFRDLSREHNLVRSFVYDRVSKGKGTGEQLYPQVFLEDPIIVHDATLSNGAVVATVNFDVTMLPHAADNYCLWKLDEGACQDVSHEIAMNMIVKMRELNGDVENRNGLNVDSFNFMSLRNWGDDNAAGVRCTLQLILDADVKLCDSDLHFNPDKQFEAAERLSNIATDGASSCHEEYDYKLPKFNL